MPCSVATPTINEQDLAELLEKKCSVGTSTPVNDLRRSPSLGQLNCRSPLTPINAVRRAASMSPQRCGGSDQVLNGSTSCQEDENKENRTLQYEEEFIKYKPG